MEWDKKAAAPDLRAAMLETRGSFHGRETPQRILISAGEWTAFSDACRKAGVEPRGSLWFQWKMHEPPFRSASTTA